MAVPGSFQSPIEAPPLERMPLLSAVQSGTRGYGRYHIETNHVTVPGLLQLPTAGPAGSPCDICRVHAPYRMKTVEWVVERKCVLGEKPVLPHWDTGNPNEALTFHSVVAENPVLQINGSLFLWVVRGTYMYALGVPPQTYGSGATPACITPVEQFGLTEADFSKDFLRSTDSGNNQQEFAGLVFDKSLR